MHVVVMMMVMVVMMMVVVRGRGGRRRRGGRWGGVFGEGVTGEAERERGGDGENLDHGKAFLC